LESLSLLPIEWYNLATIHSPEKFYLHDDFYDDDGTATQPNEDVGVTTNSKAPTLREVADNLENLLDFANTRYFLREDIINALGRFDKTEVLNSLVNRVSTIPNYLIETRAYEICARVIGKEAEEWIRTRWNMEDVLLFPLAEATAACLPLDEGYNLVLSRLKKVTEKELPQASGALLWFRYEKALDWIEEKVSSPISSYWGQIAALSQLTWERVEKWLDMGRPHSFLALDALNACWNYNTLVLKRFEPKLLQPDSIENMTSRLFNYKKLDSVPRVLQKVDSIINNWGKICIQESKP
jgi:hypothetical protein